MVEGCKEKTKASVVEAFVFSRAGNETRTRDPNLGKVVLYQLSYSRLRVLIIGIIPVLCKSPLVIFLKIFWLQRLSSCMIVPMSLSPRPDRLTTMFASFGIVGARMIA